MMLRLITIVLSMDTLDFPAGMVLGPLALQRSTSRLKPTGAQASGLRRAAQSGPALLGASARVSRHARRIVAPLPPSAAGCVFTPPLLWRAWLLDLLWRAAGSMVRVDHRRQGPWHRMGTQGGLEHVRRLRPNTPR